MMENEEDGSLYFVHVNRFVTGLLRKRRRPTSTNRFGKTGHVRHDNQSLSNPVCPVNHAIASMHFLNVSPFLRKRFSS